jgi:mRNA-degrading endonuclease RelE of RelBE toxin-antitoxin system
VSSAWTLEFTPKALRQLRKLPPKIRARIITKIERELSAKMVRAPLAKR